MKAAAGATAAQRATKAAENFMVKDTIEKARREE
jgi:hypothetical protein